MKIRLGKRVIASVEYSSNPVRIGHGLRFSKLLKKGTGLLMTIPRESRYWAMIDMFFVFFPIDVVWMDKEKRIVDIRRNVKPWRLAMPKMKAMHVLELNASAAVNLKIGDILTFSIK